MHRREMLLTAGAAFIGLSAFPLGWARAEDNKKQKILYYTKSGGFVHPEVNRKLTDGVLSRSEKLLTQWGENSGFEVVCTQDPAVFDGDIDQFDAIAFYTSGNPLSDEQKKKLLDAIEAGKAFIGIHSATDTFRKPNSPEIDPYIAMVGAEFFKHDASARSEKSRRGPEVPRHARPRRFHRSVRRMVHFQKIRQGPARHPRARDRRHERPLLSAPPVSRHLGTHVRQGPRILHLHGTPPGNLERQNLPANPPRRHSLGPGQRQGRNPAEHRAGNARGKYIGEIISHYCIY